MMKKLLFPTALIAVIIFSAISFRNAANSTSDSPQYHQRKALSFAEGESEGEKLDTRYMMLDATTGEYNPGARSELMSRIENRASRAEPLGLNIIQRGPDNVGGRTRAIIELKGYPDTLLAGGVTGGVFVSTNGGGTWSAHNQFQNLDASSSIIASMVQDYSSGAIYVGTGSSYDASAGGGLQWPGHGIYVSYDLGVTFEHLESTTPTNRLDQGGDPWLAVNRIAIGPGGEIYAATHTGLRVSTDGGDTWFNPIYSDPGNQFPLSAVCSDVRTTSTGKVYVAFNNGSVHMSEDGSDKSFINLSSNGLSGPGGRIVLDISPQDEDYVYALFVTSSSAMAGLHKSTNGGESWDLILQPFDDFDPMCRSTGGGNLRCQGMYDAAMGISGYDKDAVLIGGITIWRFDGNLTIAATLAGGPPFSDVQENYVHADVHYVYRSPNDPTKLYVTTDGGITSTTNNGQTWQGLNKGYVTTQFYGIAYTPILNQVLGGTQDNGTLAVLGDNPSDPLAGIQATGNDGFDCAISQLSGLYYSSSQDGMMFRGEQALPVAIISGMEGGPFWTVLQLWEKDGDLTSKDSITFSVDTFDFGFATSNGILRAYNEVIAPVQPSAIVIKDDITVYAGGLELHNTPEDPETLVGDGEGTLEFNEDGTFTVDVKFESAPSENTNIGVVFAVKYKANSVILVESENLNVNLASYIFEHRLETDLNPGDQLKIQDPVQSLLAKTGPSGLIMYRGALNIQQIPSGTVIPGIPANITCIEFSSDGNHCFVGTGGLFGQNNGNRVYRISGLNNFYGSDDLDELTVEQVHNVTGPITGISIDPNNDNNVAVTVGRYKGTANVYYSTNALGGASFTNVSGDLPAFPVYDIEIDRNDGKIAVIGTEFGVWATRDITAVGGQVEWTDENDELTYVPTYDVRQQSLPWNRASNSGVYYFGTHGRGIWESSTLVSAPEISHVDLGYEGAISELNIYPNPISDFAYVEFEGSVNSNATISIYDLNGRQVRTLNERVVAGQNKLSFDALNLRSGQYIMTMEVDGTSRVSKFLVMR